MRPLLSRLFCCALLCLPVPVAAESAAALPPIDTAPNTGAEFALTREPALEVVEDLPPVNTIDLTTAPEDLWQRVRMGFAMPNLDGHLVADRQAWYLNRPEMLKTLLDRSRRYLYYIVDELQKRGMPTELALLPLVESAYNPMAYSRARASGIWQFIPSTGRSYRLEQNWWRDQRRDIIASTGAALDYLQTIYEMNGDWHLALASYNWGENAVARAVTRNQARGQPTDYLSLSMPSETRYYVPKLQALKNIIAQPQLFGINLDPIPNQAYFGTVNKPGDMDVSLAAKLAETPLSEFVALNPAYNRPVMQGAKGSPMLLPADKVQVFLNNLENHERLEKPLSTWRTYTIKKGDKFESVAAHFGLSPASLKQINGITRKTRVGTGTTLLVPAKGSPASANLQAINLPLTPPDLPKERTTKSKSKTPAKAHKTTGKSAKAKKQAGVHKKAVVPSKKKKAPAKKRL